MYARSGLAYAEVLLDETATIVVAVLGRAVASMSATTLPCSSCSPTTALASRSIVHAIACPASSICHLETGVYLLQSNGTADISSAPAVTAGRLRAVAHHGADENALPTSADHLANVRDSVCLTRPGLDVHHSRHAQTKAREARRRPRRCGAGPASQRRADSRRP